MEGAPLAQPALLTMARGAGIPFLGPGQEQQIPLLSFDLQRYLLADSTLTPPERNELRKFSELLREILHREFLSWIDALLDLYSPLDPDSEVIPIQNSSLARSDGSDETFLKAFETVLLRANFRELKSAEVMEAIRAPNELGLNYEPNFELFEHLKVFVRGRTKVKRGPSESSVAGSGPRRSNCTPFAGWSWSSSFGKRASLIPLSGLMLCMSVYSKMFRSWTWRCTCLSRGRRSGCGPSTRRK